MQLNNKKFIELLDTLEEVRKNYNVNLYYFSNVEWIDIRIITCTGEEIKDYCQIETEKQLQDVKEDLIKKYIKEL